MRSLNFKINNFTIKRFLLVKAEKRSFIDPVTWLVFFVFSLFFQYLYIRFSPIGNIDPIALMLGSFAFTLFMTMPVYFNLFVLNKFTLEQKSFKNKFCQYGTYLIGVTLNALFFAFVLEYVFKTNWILPDLDLLDYLVIIFGVQLIATGLINRRNLLEQNRYIVKLEKSSETDKEKLNEAEIAIQDLNGKLEEIQVRVQYFEKELEKSKKMRQTLEEELKQDDGKPTKIFLGTKNKFEIIYSNIIVHIQSDGNRQIFFTDDKKGKYYGDKSMNYWEKSLPRNLFQRVHRKHIVAINKIKGKKGNTLILEGDIKITISKSYEREVDKLMKYSKFNSN